MNYVNKGQSVYVEMMRKSTREKVYVEHEVIVAAGHSARVANEKFDRWMDVAELVAPDDVPPGAEKLQMKQRCKERVPQLTPELGYHYVPCDSALPCPIHKKEG